MASKMLNTAIDGQILNMQIAIEGRDRDLLIS